MRVGDVLVSGATRSRGAALLTNGLVATLAVLAALAGSAPFAAAGPLQDETYVDLPWSALPGAAPGAKPLHLSIARLPVVTGDEDLDLDEWAGEPVTTGIGTTLWAGDRGTLVFGFALDQEKKSDYEPSDRLFGDLRKRYTAVFKFDQPLGFSTSFIFDVLSKDKTRGQREFKVLQLAVTRPLGDDGSLSAGTAVVLDGLKPELNIGFRLFLPLNGN
jgi:hypothetical protein